VNPSPKKNSPHKRRLTATVLLVSALGLLVLTLFIARVTGKKETIAVSPPADTAIAPKPDTIHPVIKDTAPPPRPVKPSARTKAKIDSTPRDTARAAADTPAAIIEHAAIPLIPQKGGCAQDTLAVWAYPEPSGGLHHGPVTLQFRSNKPCAIVWQLSTDTAWHEYHDEAITLDTSVAVLWNAADSCGNEMPTREELYEIETVKKTTECSADMELVKIGTMRFCIDRYEWPNRKGVVPTSYVSLYQAGDSCFAQQKRLCSSEEWSLACSGPYSWNYPYGQNYEAHACVTSDTAPQPSGMKSECRAYFGVFDMSGNLAEWTSTPAKENRQYNNVMGGFWESGPRSGCQDTRYSYFPQNRHNPVGFRCCKDIAGTGQ
jgi:hypothetical protein